MAFPWVFANLPAGNTAAAKLDDNFNALGTYATVPCSATGTNTIVLTPAAGSPSLAAYNQLQAYRFIAAATSTSTVSIQVSALASLPAYRPTSSGPTALGSGFIVVGESYDAVYDAALNSGGGGFHVYNIISATSSSGKLVSISYASLATYTTCSTAVPNDDTVPTSSEGDQILTTTATTATSTQVIYIDVNVNVWQAGGGLYAVSVFNGSTNIGSEFSTVNAGSAGGKTRLLIKFSPAAAATYTLNVRCGPAGGASVEINGNASARIGGGAQIGAVIKAEVIEP